MFDMAAGTRPPSGSDLSAPAPRGGHDHCRSMTYILKMLDNGFKLPPLRKSLSARLLVMTIFFVMLAEVFIYAPSIGRFRYTYLQEALARSHLASLALEATPDNMVTKDLARQLLDHAGAHSIVLRGKGRSKLMLMRTETPPVDKTFDLGAHTFMGLIMDAFRAMGQDGNRVLRIIGPSSRDAGVTVEAVIDEEPMRLAMIDYSQRILALSIGISIFTAALVYASLQLMMVFPMRRIAENMAAFRRAPEDRSSVINPGGRTDEVGLVERHLHDMQATVRTALRQKERLAAVGTAVTKINHDLRGILANASLISDRLGHVEDPEARRLAPKIMRSIDKAVALCASTLKFTKDEIPELTLVAVPLRDVVDEVGASLPARKGETVVKWENAVPEALCAEADRSQLIRALSNLGSNAAEAGAGSIRFVAERENGRVRLDVIDDGPGLPERAMQNLFRPFAGSARAGGTGLGLVIARDVARAHGGDLRLVESNDGGTCFRIELPAVNGRNAR